MESNEYEQKIQDLKLQVFQFKKNKLSPNISSSEFINILDELEDIVSQIFKLGVRADIFYFTNTRSVTARKFKDRIRKLESNIGNNIQFFFLWWIRLDQINLERLIKYAGDLQEYLNYMRKYVRYDSNEMFYVLNIPSLSESVDRYYKTINTFEYKIKIQSKFQNITCDELVNYLQSNDSNIRCSAYQAMLTKYQQYCNILGKLYKQIVQNWKDERLKIRDCKSPISMRNIVNNIDDETIESLLDTCKRNRDVFKRFFIQKAKLLDLKQLRLCDIHLSMYDPNKHRYSYDMAVKLVLESIGKFSNTLEEHAKRVFEQNHVDSEIRQGKRGDAFCCTLGQDLVPFVLLNFTGKHSDVFTLAHEIGHAIHHQTIQKPSILHQNVFAPVSEVASAFSESLLYHNMSEQVSDKRTLISQRINDLYVKMMCEAFYTIFEIDAHNQIDKRTPIEQISDIYLENIRYQFGTTVDISDDFRVDWLSNPDFFHKPFSSYTYAFGNLFALSLFQRYLKEGKDFVSSYIEILAAGGYQKPEDILSKQGFDIHSSKFWQQGFDYIKTQVDMLESLRE